MGLCQAEQGCRKAETEVLAQPGRYGKAAGIAIKGPFWQRNFCHKCRILSQYPQITFSHLFAVTAINLAAKIIATHLSISQKPSKSAAFRGSVLKSSMKPIMASLLQWRNLQRNQVKTAL